jgi:hypothetical protein
MLSVKGEKTPDLGSPRRSGRASPDNHDDASGMRGAVLAHRAEQEAREPSAAPGADDEQGGSVRRRDERGAGCASDRLARHADAVGRRRVGGLQHFAGLHCERGADLCDGGGARHARGGDPPRLVVSADREDADMAQLGFGVRPFLGRPRPRRAVDADDDPRPLGRACVVHDRDRAGRMLETGAGHGSEDRARDASTTA